METKQLPDDYHEWIKAQTFAIGGKKIGLRPTLLRLIRDGCKYCKGLEPGPVRIHGSPTVMSSPTVAVRMSAEKTRL